MENLLLARRRKKLTQKQLGDKVGISDIKISRFENGVTVPRADILKKIAIELGVTVDYLLKETS